MRSAAAMRLRVNWMTAERSGSGGNGTGRRRTILQGGRLGAAAVEQIERGAGAEAAGADAEPGVAERVHGAAAEGLAEEDGEAAAGVDVLG